LVTIDDELVSALIQPDEFAKIGKDAPIKGITCLRIKDYETEAYIGERRTADILLTVVKDSVDYKVVVEVENDREFDVGEILRKIKKSKEYPAVVIIAKEFERFAWRFQNSGIGVAFWTTTCKWHCRVCRQITMTSTSSITPSKCSKCNKNQLVFNGIDDTEFENAENNPPLIKDIGTIRISFDKVVK
jgi:hypothetical protein